jgi:hypothetical protein
MTSVIGKPFSKHCRTRQREALPFIKSKTDANTTGGQFFQGFWEFGAPETNLWSPIAQYEWRLTSKILVPRE